MLSKILDIIQYPNPLLNKVSEPVQVIDDEITQLISNMKATMKSVGGVGLAAIQVGVPLRIFLLDTSNEVNPNQNSIGHKVFINPEIVEVIGEPQLCEEGCLSFPGLFVNLKRSTIIFVKFINENGAEWKLELQGLDAIAFQHELDHINGITFFDRLSPLKKEMAKKKMKKLKLA